MIEQVLRQGRRGKTKRPFQEFAKVSARGCSLTLQRKIADFGAERSGRSTIEGLREHYSIEIPLYTIDAVTTRAARAAHAFNMKRQPKEKTANIQVSEIDGSMVPIVEFKGVEEVSDPLKKADKRKRRRCQWNEIRVCTAHDIDCADAHYGVSFGGVLEANLMLQMTSVQCGMDDNTQIHGVGDGACWIAQAYEKQFGTQASFLLDFYHLCEYLAEASQICAPCKTSKGKKAWLERQKKWLKRNRPGQVLRNLHRHMEAPGVLDEDAPVRRCYQYMNNRKKQLDYLGAIKQNLPIGSGEVESAHRHLIQRRLKLAGAWWLKKTAANMAQLRVTRANNDWNQLWLEKAA